MSSGCRYDTELLGRGGGCGGRFAMLLDVGFLLGWLFYGDVLVVENSYISFCMHGCYCYTLLALPTQYSN